jgi:hypothetical protein
MQADARALKILMDTYWSSAGWKPGAFTPPEDFLYAQNAGVMFAPTGPSHAEVAARLRSAYAALPLAAVSAAFLASLSTRRLELRSALGSFAVARNFPDHAYQGGGRCCALCGGVDQPQQPFDWSRFNFERYHWGGVAHERPEYAAFDLEQFAKLAPIQPARQDLDVMRAIVAVLRRAGPEAKPRDLEKQLAGVLKSNRSEREVLLQILAYCGILQPAQRVGYYQSFPHLAARAAPPVSKIDWTYPICWWRGADGIQEEALAFYFPGLI